MGNLPTAQPGLGNMQYAQQSPAPRPLVRAQAPDEPPAAARPAPAQSQPMALRIPSPEELGIGRGDAALASPARVDWSAVHGRLDQLGATCFLMQRNPDGIRVSCLLPAGQQGKSRHVEARASSEAEAVRLTLAKVEEWATAK